MTDRDLIQHARNVVERHGIKQSTILIDNLADALEIAIETIDRLDLELQDIGPSSSVILSARGIIAQYRDEIIV